MDSLKDQFLLDPHVVFLNHGSFGATPRPVFTAYQAWQTRLEQQPVRFLGRELNGLLREARCALADFLGARPDDLVFVPNATHGVNIAARSLELTPGDEVLATNHEYGACDHAWEFLCSRNGARYIRQSILLPVGDGAGMAQEFWQGVTSRTKVIYLSHITSPTALRLPVEEICRRARQRGILTVIDAAHSPGQIPVGIESLGADIVFGNCHKWLMSPKGAAFLYVRPEVQPRIEPLVVSWGYKPTPETTTGSPFIDLLQWTGTKDPSAALAVPEAIRFMAEHGWDRVRLDCHELLRSALERINRLTGLAAPVGLDSDLYAQMGIAPLPPVDAQALKVRLYDEFRVELPVTLWHDHQFIRISVQGYNTAEDLDTLIHALEELLPILRVPHGQAV